MSQDMKKKTVPPGQLLLFPAEEEIIEQTEDQAKERPTAKSAAEAWCRDHSQEQMRTYLFDWGKQHNYPKLEVSLEQPYYGFHSFIFPPGESAWMKNCREAREEWLPLCIERCSICNPER